MAEEINQQSLGVELGLRGIASVSKPVLEVLCKGQKRTAHYVPDLCALGGITGLVEISVH